MKVKRSDGNKKSVGLKTLNGKLVGNASKHNHTGTYVYRIWKGMKERCYNTKRDNYTYYGGRGIKVCDKWLNSFENFLSDMGFPPSNNHSIDRIDVNGNYCPENCRWATNKVQFRNRRNCRQIYHNGSVKCLSDWSEIYGIKVHTLMARLNRGWSMERALRPIELR